MSLFYEARGAQVRRRSRRELLLRDAADVRVPSDGQEVDTVELRGHAPVGPQRDFGPISVARARFATEKGGFLLGKKEFSFKQRIKGRRFQAGDTFHE